MEIVGYTDTPDIWYPSHLTRWFWATEIPIWEQCGIPQCHKPSPLCDSWLGMAYRIVDPTFNQIPVWVTFISTSFWCEMPLFMGQNPWIFSQITDFDRDKPIVLGLNHGKSPVFICFHIFSWLNQPFLWLVLAGATRRFVADRACALDPKLCRVPSKSSAPVFTASMTSSS